jgi:predicted nucleic acid-binding protein
MLLVDTSIWIDHFRKSNADLVKLLEIGTVATHPFIIGELALGQQKQQKLIIEALSGVPHVPLATDNEVMMFIATAKLAGSGIGYIDAHLLASASLAKTRVWTRDKKLTRVLHDLDLAHL